MKRPRDASIFCSDTRTMLNTGGFSFSGLLTRIDFHLKNVTFSGEAAPKKPKKTRKQLWQPFFTDADFIAKRMKLVEEKGTLQKLKKNLKTVRQSSKNELERVQKAKKDRTTELSAAIKAVEQNIKKISTVSHSSI